MGGLITGIHVFRTERGYHARIRGSRAKTIWDVRLNDVTSLERHIYGAILFLREHRYVNECYKMYYLD